MTADAGLVDRLITSGAAEHPGVAEAPRLRAALEKLALGGASAELQARASDLYLAHACADGDARALAILDRQLGTTIRPALAKLGMPAGDDDEIIQRVRVELLAPDEAGERGLARYSGRGELRAYVRAVAVRLALKRIEREPGPSPTDADELLELVPDAADTAALQLLKQRYRDDLRVAFAAAFAELSARERTLLRQHYLDGLTIDVLAPLHQVHRSTCARWIEAARTKVLREVRKQLRGALDLDDLDRAVDLVRSQLDLSLNRHLATKR